ncbi:unnamed protein product [Clonostachys rosea]|uniref:Transcription factor domain-containing protein n=1 Tax=Bionectria ochroleuca TaxID=29856 RepID=A0ABY6TNM4_BIOOC|nr:unnamed protein product [Clonostachys rosea]
MQDASLLFTDPPRVSSFPASETDHQFVTAPTVTLPLQPKDSTSNLHTLYLPTPPTQPAPSPSVVPPLLGRSSHSASPSFIATPPASDVLPSDTLDIPIVPDHDYVLIGEYWELPDDTSEQTQLVYDSRPRHFHKVRKRLHHQKAHNDASADLLTSGAVSRSAEEARVIGLFWESYLPNGKPFPPGNHQVDLGGSINAMIDIANNNSTVYKGLVAMAFATVGARNTEAGWMRKEGHRFYGDALHELSQSFKGVEKWTEDQLQATRLFSIYEAFHGADSQSHMDHRRSWMVHSGGDVALLTSKPPSAYISGYSHMLFVAGRHHLALSALMARKRCFLSDPVWKTVPWTEHEKTPRDRLLDILVDLPAILEAIDVAQVWKDADKKRTCFTFIVKGLLRLLDRMLEWHDQHFSSLEEFPRYLDEQLPEVIKVGQLAAAHVMSLYWSMCVRAVTILHKLQPPGSPRHPIDIDACCHDIVCTLRIFTHPSAGMFRQHITPFPMSTALLHLMMVEPAILRREREVLLREMGKPECDLVRMFILSLEPRAIEKMQATVKESRGGM